jgi:hypothetical protein
MPANTNPIFGLTPNVQTNGTTGMSQAVLSAAADYTGTNANNTLCYTAGSNGAFLQRIRFKPIGTNVASVARIYINNGSTNTSASNNTFIGEISLPATTAIATSALMDIDYPLNIAIPAGFRIYWGLGTAVAAGWVATVIGADF